MRLAVVLAVCTVLSVPAFAQTADGKAEVSGKTGDALAKVAAAGGVKTRADMRAILGAVIEGGAEPAEQDLLAELASGAAFSAKASGRDITVPAVSPDLKWVPQTLLTPPNLHTLWCVTGQPTEAFIEMSRWTPATYQRIYTFIGNQMDDAWKQSNLTNAYSPYVQALACEWNALKTLPADPEMRTAAYDVLTTGVAYAIDKARREGREAPQAFLYQWTLDPGTKQSFINGAQWVPTPAPQ